MNFLQQLYELNEAGYRIRETKKDEHYELVEMGNYTGRMLDKTVEEYKMDLISATSSAHRFFIQEEGEYEKCGCGEEKHVGGDEKWCCGKCH